MFFSARRRSIGPRLYRITRPQQVQRGRFGKIRAMPERREGAILGVDVGGTKLAAGHVVGREVVASVEHATPRTSAGDLIASLEAAVGELREKAGPPVAI